MASGDRAFRALSALLLILLSLLGTGSGSVSGNGTGSGSGSGSAPLVGAAQSQAQDLQNYVGHQSHGTAVTGGTSNRGLQSQSQDLQDYAGALHKSLLYFEGQRAGKLPASQRVTWRRDSALSDGRDVGADLSKGYYDSGDNVKFVFPMAFSLTMLAWGTFEYQEQLQAHGEEQWALDAIRWGTDFLLNAHPQDNTLHVEVGDGASDHACWMRPEDMTTDRSTYTLHAANPGSDVAGEAAAALAAASLAFNGSDPQYASRLLQAARSLFSFADNHRGRYQDMGIPIVAPFYPSTAYEDELLWGAAWLLRATGEDQYQQYLLTNGPQWGATNSTERFFSWDGKLPGVQSLVAGMILRGDIPGGGTLGLEGFKTQAQAYTCSMMYGQKTPGGLAYVWTWSSLQFVTTGSMAILTLADAMKEGGAFSCEGGQSVGPLDMVGFVKSQVDYILGNNPRGMSYMVGHGAFYPTHYHHRAANIPPISVLPWGSLNCTEGMVYFSNAGPNANTLTGAIVGGPAEDDSFNDTRVWFQGNEPSTYIVAPMVGVLARMTSL